MKIVATAGVAVCLIVSVIHVEGNVRSLHNVNVPSLHNVNVRSLHNVNVRQVNTDAVEEVLGFLNTDIIGDAVEEGLGFLHTDKRGGLNELHVELREKLSRKKRAFHRSKCNKIYSDLFVNHTMCLVDVGYDNGEVTEAEKTSIIQQHNAYRSNVTYGATNMNKVVWDDAIAIVAAKWARQCIMEHDPNNARSVPELPGVYVGQNAGYGYLGFTSAIKGWYDEYVDYQYGVGATSENKNVGHYTQVVSWKAARIGCGSAYCPNSVYFNKIHHICNYAIGQSDLLHPYETGTSCARCPNKCSDNLCDCGGKLCFNGGKLDLATCTCQCPTLYTGDTCDVLNCPIQQPSYCGRYQESYCDRYSKVRTSCPQLCGICPKPCDGLTCENLGTLDVATCTCKCRTYYSGDKCQTLTCPTSISTWCSSVGQIGCTRYSNVPYDCPILCGKCGALPCDNKCLNYGKLNMDTCNCKCTPNYSGDKCQLLNCIKADPSYCGTYWKVNYCSYSNVPFHCVHMCGKC